MSDGEKSGPKMLRMVRYRSVKQDADRFRHPTEYDVDEALSLACNLGDVRTARRFLNAWMEEKLDGLDARQAPRDDYVALRAQYFAALAKLHGRLAVMSTELGWHSANVAPDYGKVTYNFHDWASPGLLTAFFGPGREVVVWGHTGTGKTHLTVQFMERALALTSPSFNVITNVSGVQDTTGKYADRIHCVSLLSEVLRIWCNLPEGARILLVLDEPESTLQGGNTRNNVDFKVFRFMLRKLGIAKVEIWHNESDQYKGLREDTSEQVVRIKKDTLDAFTVLRRQGDQMIRQRVENVPKECGLTYATEGMATIGVDVDIGKLIMRIGKLWRPGDIKAEVRRAMEDPAMYYPEFQSRDAIAQAAAARIEDQRRRDEERVAAILANEERFLARRGEGFDRGAIQRHFGITERDADYLALRAAQARPPRDSIEAAVQAVLARPEEFLGKARRSFDREKIMRGLGLSFRDAQIVARKAWSQRGAD